MARRSFLFERIKRAWINSKIPAIEVPDLPADPKNYSEILNNLKTFAILNITTEDLQKTKLYFEEKKRKEYNIKNSRFFFLVQVSVSIEIIIC